MSFMFPCSQNGSWLCVCRYFSGMGCVPTTTGRPYCFSMNTSFLLQNQFNVAFVQTA